MTLYPVVMAGGSGTRFWPLSRAKTPKQFLPLASEKPLLVDTLDRLPPLAGLAETFVVCGPAHAASVSKLVKKLPKQNVLVEPVARNTAPAIGLAAIQVAARDPKGVLVVLPSDHHVGDPKGFRGVVDAAARLASKGHLVTIGITPTRPDTGYGYIHLGEPLAAVKGKPAHLVQRFVEKPDVDRARAYLSAGDYLWNAGIFCFRADVILNEIRAHLPRLAAALDDIAAAIGTPKYASVLKKRFPESEPTSIDYGVMERAKCIACVPGDFGWSDVGSFAALPDVRPLDSHGNVAPSNAVLVDVRGSVVVSERTVALIGVSDLVVVDAGDTLLVMPKDRAQDVRKVVEVLQKRGATQLL